MVVVGGRQAGADVEELPDTGLLGQVTDGPPEQAPILHRHDPDGREELGDLVAGLPVGLTRTDVDEWVEMIARLRDNTATDPGDEREAERAAAMLWSGFGYLDAPTDVLRMFVQAIEVGYMAALGDVRDGKVTADLVAGLDTVLHHPRLHTRPEPADTDAAADLDALTVLNALATATASLTTDQVADVLAWKLERVTTALARAATNPELAGPLALRQAAANTYTVTPRLDLLTSDERRRLHETARWNQPLDVEQANVLLAALVLHDNQYADQPGPTYAEWREGHLDTERELRVSGLLYADYKPQDPKINPEVLYSLRCQETPHQNGH